MEVPLQVALLVLVGFVSGVVNTMAGGGSLLTLPALIFLGMPAPVANATNRVNVLLQTATATQQFARRGLIPFKKTLWPLGFASAGAVVGAYFSADIDADQFERIIGVAMLIMLGLLIINPGQWLTPGPTIAPLWVQAIAFVAVGAYGGFLQAGVGFFLLFALVGLGDWDLVSGNGAKSLLVAVFTVPALIFFAWRDLIAWGPGLALSVGSVAGAWVGTRLAIGWGPKLVRWVLVVAVTAASSRLLGLW